MLDNKTKEWETLYENIPCRLSFMSSPPTDENYASSYDKSRTTGRQIGATRVTSKAKIFLKPEHLFRTGARLSVNRNEQMFFYKQAGEAKVYSEHIEIELQSAKEWS